jgi:hypothetical protein
MRLQEDTTTTSVAGAPEDGRGARVHRGSCAIGARGERCGSLFTRAGAMKRAMRVGASWVDDDDDNKRL